MQRLRWVRAFPLAVFSLFLPLACGDSFQAGSPGGDGGSDGTSFDGRGDDSPGDDRQGDDSPADDGGSDVVHVDGSGDGPGDGPIEAPSPSIVYVSQSTGNDNANDGLSSAKPKKTIVAGLAAAAQHGLTQVHVCKGVYIETGLNVSSPVSLLGSFDCVTWTRTAGYGYPTFDGVNTTAVLDANIAVQSAAMLVTGTVGPLSLIDGFNIQGSSSSAGQSVGVQTQDTASPIFSNDRINGGSGKSGASGVGSVGFAVVGASAPEVKDCFVNGGNGNGATGSAAFSVSTTGAPRIHDDVVSGGTGTTNAAGGVAAVGVSVGSSLTTTNGTALTSLLVAGADPAGTTGTTIAILVGGSGVSADIIGCDINAGNGSGTSSQSFGILVSTVGGATRVIADRIYGGLRSGASVQSYGVFGASASDLTVENTMIHAGSTAGTGTTYASGVVVENVPSATIVDDTIYTGAGPGYAIQLLAGAAGVRITDDYLVGAGATSNIALGAYACTGVVTSLDHTAFSNFADVYACTASATVTTTAATLTQLYADLPSVAAADVIIEAAASCGTDVTCVADPSCPATPTQCLPSLFGASWTSSDDGTGGLFSGSAVDGGSTPGGWTLPAPGSPCAVARGGTPVGGVATDIFGVTRNAGKPTIGAAEYTSGACN